MDTKKPDDPKPLSKSDVLKGLHGPKSPFKQHQILLRQLQKDLDEHRLLPENPVEELEDEDTTTREVQFALAIISSILSKLYKKIRDSTACCGLEWDATEAASQEQIRALKAGRCNGLFTPENETLEDLDVCETIAFLHDWVVNLQDALLEELQS